MAEISIRRKHGYDDPEAVRSRIEGLADRVSERLGGHWRWDGNEAVCKAKGVEARVGYDRHEIHIDVQLPLAFRPLRHKLEEKIEEYYARYFEQDRE